MSPAGPWGIWKKSYENDFPVEMIARDLSDLGITEVYYFTNQCSEGHARVGVQYQLRLGPGEDWRGCELHFAGACGGSRFEHKVPCEFVAGNTAISINAPHLWWPKGYGEPDLYATTCRLVRDGRVLDERTDRVGIRTVELMVKQIHEMFGIEPETLEDFVLASQICQAEAKKFFIEMVRLMKWRMTGVLWWNVMDCWPQFSDAVVDYYFRRKLAYAYIKRVQQPACIMMTEPANWVSRVILGNDSRKTVSGEFRIRDADSGEVVLEGKAHAGPNENRALGQIRASRGTQRLFLIDWTLNGEQGRNHYLLGTPPFDIECYRRWLAALVPEDVDAIALKGVSGADKGNMGKLRVG